MKGFSGVVRLLWPPLALGSVNRDLQKDFDHFMLSSTAYTGSVHCWLRKLQKQNATATALDSMAEDVFDSEAKRRKMIDDKATALFPATGLALTLVSLAAVLVTKETVLPCFVVGVALMAAIVAVLYLVAAAHHALQATLVAAWFVVTPSSLDEAAAHGDVVNLWMAYKLANTEVNYKVMLIKSNHLSVSQALLRRGLLAVASAGLLIALGGLATLALSALS